MNYLSKHSNFVEINSIYINKTLVIEAEIDVAGPSKWKIAVRYVGSIDNIRNLYYDSIEDAKEDLAKIVSI